MPLGGVRAEHDPELAHDGGGVGVVPLDVPDDGADPAAGQRDQVVPVSADVPAEAGGAVADGDLSPGHGRDPARQHGLLEALGEVVLLFVEHRALEALGDRRAERHQQIAFVGGEAALVPVEQAERADRAGLGDQRHVGGGGDPEVADVGPQDRVGGGEVLGGLDEARGQCADHFAHRVLLVHPGVPGAGDVRAFGAVGHQVDAAGLQQAHDETGGPEVGEALGVLEDGDDVLDRTGVGQGGGGALDEAGALATLLVQFAPGGGVGQFLGGVADDPDDAARASGPVPADEALGVGPAQGAVAPLDAEVRAVVGAPALQGVRDHPVQALGLVRRNARRQ
ncbi:hypothetical protein GA0115255_118782 [Streptomyces sp. Ncost-T6T-2b]|nr:hypothetical protein GA0115255_118782 [Streptomyces sp. Ncost-T6T-2b]